MFELEKKHKLGTKTFIYLFVLYGWWLALIGIGLLAAGWLIYFGPAQSATQQFLASQKDWYITSTMLSEWVVLFGLAFIFFGYLRTSVMYRYHKFILDDYAFHIHRGWFSVREITIPYHQISNVYIIRPYHYRLFGIAKLDIVTAANRNSEKDEDQREILIPIIDKSLARALSKYLLRQAAKKTRNYPQTETVDEEDDSEEDADDPEEENEE